MIRCADCKHFKYIGKHATLNGCFCLGKGGFQLLDENLVYKYSKSFMCNLYSPLPGKELEVFKKEN